MDQSQFDRITRSLAHGVSRRSVLRGLFGGLAALAGRGAAMAKPSCREAGHPCEGNQTCCDGLVCVVSGPGKAKRCTACPAGQVACGGACIPACTASDACHVAGVCDPGTGTCTNPLAPEGTPCDGGSGTCGPDGDCVPNPANNCAAGDNACETGGISGCNDNPNCLCLTTTEGTEACVDATNPDLVCPPEGETCVSSADCGDGFCVNNLNGGCCEAGLGFCLPNSTLCSSGAGARSAATVSRNPLIP